MNNSRGHRIRGQAFLELILVLPVLFFLIIFGLQIFRSIYEAQYKQEIVRERILETIAFQANGGFQPNGEPKLPQVVEEVASAPIETQGLPFLGGAAAGGGISIKVGMCREPTGDCK